MRAPHSYAVAVRKPNGEIVAKSELLPALSEKYPILKLPVLRGSAVLIQSMLLGIKALNFSANVAFHEGEGDDQADKEVELVQPVVTAGPGTLAAVGVATQARPIATAKTSAKAKAKKTTTAGAAGSIVFALFFQRTLFIVLPLLLTNMLFVYLEGGTLGAASASGTWYADGVGVGSRGAPSVRPSVAFNLWTD